MDREMKINEFVTALEMMSSELLKMIYNTQTPCLDTLVKKITKYMNENYPHVSFSKEELLNAVYKVYQKKDMNLKKSIVEKNYLEFLIMATHNGWPALNTS